jgi:L-cysteine:1D-myo-inositol 2-amino-2-deoxy-alpha-D-glucopyranoside ligase
MRSWPGPAVPRLPGEGVRLRLHDTARGDVHDTAAGPSVRMYVCGITPYDATHLGHAMTFLTFDLVHRMWLDAGHDVHYVQNVTDVDDPLLERAERDGEDWVKLAERETALLREDMTALRILPPTYFVGAVEAIPEIVERVVALLDLGTAYRVGDDVYYSVDADPRFGYESALDAATMWRLSAENGGDPERPGKKNPLDPVLWRASEPGSPFWDSTLGPGRPGWHIECAAIALNRLGVGLDVQGGGRDLIFPHHEMTAAHAESLTGQWPFARHYVHVGLVGLDGEKMSKSRGNLVFVHRLRADDEPAVVRLALLADHYRADHEWSPTRIDEARDRLATWRRAVGHGAGPSAGPVLADVRRQLADDLDTAAALSTVDSWAAGALRDEGADAGAPDLVRAVVDALLGVEL